MWQQFSNIYKSIPCKIPIVETTIANLVFNCQPTPTLFEGERCFSADSRN